MHHDLRGQWFVFMLTINMASSARPRLSRGMRKYLRREKARLRKHAATAEDAQRAVRALVARIRPLVARH